MGLIRAFNKLTLAAIVASQALFPNARADEVSTLGQARAGTHAFLLELYGEAYPLPLASQLNAYDRIRLIDNQSGLPWSIAPVLEFNEERLEGRTRSSLEFGLERRFWGSTRAILGVDARDLAHAYGEAEAQGRAGVSSGYFQRLGHSPIISEAFGEAYFIAPVKRKGFGVAAGSGKVGYRLYEKNHLIIDPFLTELRAAASTDPIAAGPDYLMLNIGPRLNVWMADPNLSMTLFVAHSQLLASSQDSSADRKYWFVLAVGGAF